MSKRCENFVRIYGEVFAWTFFVAMTLNGGFNSMFDNPVNTVLSVPTILAFAASVIWRVSQLVRFIKSKPFRRLHNMWSDVVGTYRVVKAQRNEVTVF